MKLCPAYPYYLAGVPAAPNAELAVTDKYSGREITRVALADAAAYDRAIAAAAAAAEPLRRFAPYERQAVLEHCVSRFRERAAELAHVLCLEAGKPIRDARGEVTRLIDTFRVAAGECIRPTGEVLPLEIGPRARGYRGQWKRVPLGPCGFIAPFNFPLNLAAHKMAPAIAAGCPFVLKPASLTPVGSLLMGEVLAETNLPAGAFSILPATRETADVLATDERLKLLSFTGSPEAGWSLKARAGRKKVALELGGNAACVIDADARLDDAIARVLFGAFYQSGQSCISVQRILVHESLYAAFREALVAGALQLKMGDPQREETSLGPLITDAAAARLENWVQSAVQRGARVLCGGRRAGRMFEPTLLEQVPADENLCAAEAFGPVAVLAPFTSFRAALAEVNRSRYGLQAGVFTRDVHKMHLAWDELEVGGVVINDVPSWRVDHMPYGGVKESGLGREGIRFAIEEMSEVRLLVVRDESVP